ncbi:ABC transporter permease [Cellulomonas soli]|uniref:ABC transporter permease n=1 Tax=Cellulomonas soli TaxID=931535 RepID=A0A512P8D6_9CELL|nr:ABC transporter permease [Cellulomonas soli]NYI57690.1 peptide/nickel transport system permease protein [Cellulomonas soli]GEP67469.1 ABC transporter permease [Cellulomonas soli]
MLKFLLRRLVSGVAMLFVISTVAYGLIYLTGADIARTLLGQNASQEAVDLKAQQLGLDQPLLQRYVDWLSGAIRGDLGVSWFSGAQVTDLVSARLGVTLSLVVLATLISAVLATVVGVWAAIKRGWVDRVLQIVSLVGAAIPNYLVAIALVLVVAINLAWVAPTGYVRPQDDLAGWASSIVLPVIALTIGCVAGVAQQVRSSMIDGLRQDYVRTLRSRGLPERRVILEHVLRNAAGPALSVLALLFVGLLGGAVVIEQMFAIPGLGSLSVSTTTQGDIPVIMGVVVVVAIIVLVVNLVIDIVQGWLNPKARIS